MEFEVIVKLEIDPREIEAPRDARPRPAGPRAAPALVPRQPRPPSTPPLAPDHMADSVHRVPIYANVSRGVCSKTFVKRPHGNPKFYCLRLSTARTRTKRYSVCRASGLIRSIGPSDNQNG